MPQHSLKIYNELYGIKKYKRFKLFPQTLACVPSVILEGNWQGLA